MTIPNFNLSNKFCFYEVDEILSHDSDYCFLNNISLKLFFINNDDSFFILCNNIGSITKNKENL